MGRVKEKTLEEYEISLNLFLEVVGDRPISEFGQRHGRNFRETLRKLPPRRKTDDRYRSLSEILGINLRARKGLGQNDVG